MIFQNLQIILAVFVGFTPLMLQAGTTVKSSDGLFINNLNTDVFHIQANAQLATSAAPDWQLISEIIDPQNISIPAHTDIQTATIEQLQNTLRFSFEMRGDSFTDYLSGSEFGQFYFHIDADNNPDTGQPRPGGVIGADFTVRAEVGQNVKIAAVDVTGVLPGGGSAVVKISGDTISVTISLDQISNPESFSWTGETAEQLNSGRVVRNSFTESANANVVEVTTAASQVELIPPIVQLSIAGPSSAQLTARVFDSGGIELDASQFSKQYLIDSSAEFAEVDTDVGIVTAHSPPVAFGPNPSVSVFVDGIRSANNTVVRISETDFGLQHVPFIGRNIAYYIPNSINGWDLRSMVENNLVVEATDLMYQSQKYAFGTNPFAGATQYLVLDVADDTTGVCGLAGNPVRLGWKFQNDPLATCFIGAGNIPHWFVIFHEVGHNFNLASSSFLEFANSYPAKAGNYIEGMASFGAMWTFWALESCPTVLSENVTSQLKNVSDAARNDFLIEINQYKNQEMDYDDLHASRLDGMFYELLDLYGPKVWFDILSAFPPEGPLGCNIDSRGSQATYLAAAVSSSVNSDLRIFFRDDYNFPIDDNLWPVLLQCAQNHVDARIYDLASACAAIAPEVPIFSDGFESE